jgi:hypothetical protein
MIDQIATKYAEQKNEALGLSVDRTLIQQVWAAQAVEVLAFALPEIMGDLASSLSRLPGVQLDDVFEIYKRMGLES